MSQNAILALDLGTSSAKAIVVTPQGLVLGRGQASYPTLHPRPGHDEQEIEDWLQAIISAAASARRFAPDADIVAIGITGQMHGTVLLGESREPLHPAVIWSDHRAASDLAAWQDQLGEDLPTRIGSPLSTGYLGLTVAWFLANNPALIQRIHHVLLPVDLLGYLLTGEIATVPSNAISTGLLRLEDATWDSEITAALGIDVSWLPPVFPEGSQIGSLTHAIADVLDLPSGIPVIHGGGDSMAAATATGVTTHQHALITISTGAQVVRPVATLMPEPAGRWHTWPAALPADAPGDRWLSLGALLNGGRVIDWIHRTLAPGMPIADLIELAEAAPVGSDGLLFLPYLSGERSPLLDPFARGSYLGLTDVHEPRHLVRAALEGIAFSIADVLDVMSGPGDLPDRIVFTGGGATRVLRQILANTTGRTLDITSMQDSSALGAARIAAHSHGFGALKADADWRTEISARVEPDRLQSERYRERLTIFREAAAAIAPVVHRLQQP